MEAIDPKYGITKTVSMKKRPTKNSLKYVTDPSESVWMIGRHPTRPHPERHPDIGIWDRTKVSFGKSQGPASVVKWFKKEGFDIADDGRGNMVLRKKKGEWYRFDPSSFELADIAELLPDALQIGAEVVGTAVGAVGGAATGTAAAPGPGTVAGSVAGGIGGGGVAGGIASEAKAGVANLLGFEYPPIPERMKRLGTDVAFGALAPVAGAIVTRTLGPVAKGVAVPFKKGRELIKKAGEFADDTAIRKVPRGKFPAQEVPRFVPFGATAPVGRTIERDAPRTSFLDADRRFVEKVRDGILEKDPPYLEHMRRELRRALKTKPEQTLVFHSTKGKSGQFRTGQYRFRPRYYTKDELRAAATSGEIHKLGPKEFAEAARDWDVIPRAGQSRTDVYFRMIGKEGKVPGRPPPITGKGRRYNPEDRGQRWFWSIENIDEAGRPTRRNWRSIKLDQVEQFSYRTTAATGGTQKRYWRRPEGVLTTGTAGSAEKALADYMGKNPVLKKFKQFGGLATRSRVGGMGRLAGAAIGGSMGGFAGGIAGWMAGQAVHQKISDLIPRAAIWASKNTFVRWAANASVPPGIRKILKVLSGLSGRQLEMALHIYLRNDDFRAWFEKNRHQLEENSSAGG